MFCKNCGKELSSNAQMCPGCGEPMGKIPANASDKDWIATLLLCWFLGVFGVHSFYVGKPISGVLQLLTFGGCGIWALIDLILIIIKKYEDGEGRIVTR